jgi:hypothetical protein
MCYAPLRDQYEEWASVYGYYRLWERVRERFYRDFTQLEVRKR